MLRRRKDRPDPEPVEELGSITCPTGVLVVVDLGLVRVWSGENEPLLHEGVVSAEIASSHNRAVDLEIVGPDAQEVAAQISLAAVSGRFGFDMDGDQRVLADKVADFCATTGQQASVQQIGRMPHRKRVERLLDDHAGIEVPFLFGMWAVAARGLPADRALSVRGQRMGPDGPDADRWHSIWVALDDRVPTRSEEVGHVLVDDGRLLLADPAALDSWSNEPAEGLFDVVCRGSDAEALAERLGAEVLPGIQGSSNFGWRNQTEASVAQFTSRLREARNDPATKFSWSIEPHDDRHRLLSTAHVAPTQSATIEVGGMQVTGFRTSWGDGAFPVYRDLADDGTLCRVRIELGSPATVQRARRVEELWFGELSKRAVASRRVYPDGAQVNWMYREVPTRDDDSGWRLFAGDETEDYVDDQHNAVVVPLREIIQANPGLEALLATPPPAAFERNADGQFQPVPPPELRE